MNREYEKVNQLADSLNLSANQYAELLKNLRNSGTEFNNAVNNANTSAYESLQADISAAKKNAGNISENAHQNYLNFADGVTTQTAKSLGLNAYQKRTNEAEKALQNGIDRSVLAYNSLKAQGQLAAAQKELENAQRLAKMQKNMVSTKIENDKTIYDAQTKERSFERQKLNDNRAYDLAEKNYQLAKQKDEWSREMADKKYRLEYDKKEAEKAAIKKAAAEKAAAEAAKAAAEKVAAEAAKAAAEKAAAAQQKNVNSKSNIKNSSYQSYEDARKELNAEKFSRKSTGTAPKAKGLQNNDTQSIAASKFNNFADAGRASYNLSKKGLFDNKYTEPEESADPHKNLMQKVNQEYEAAAAQDFIMNQQSKTWNNIASTTKTGSYLPQSNNLGAVVVKYNPDYKDAYYSQPDADLVIKASQDTALPNNAKQFISQKFAFRIAGINYDIMKNPYDQAKIPEYKKQYEALGIKGNALDSCIRVLQNEYVKRGKDITTWSLDELRKYIKSDTANAYTKSISDQYGNGEGSTLGGSTSSFLLWLTDKGVYESTEALGKENEEHNKTANELSKKYSEDELSLIQSVYLNKLMNATEADRKKFTQQDMIYYNNQINLIKQYMSETGNLKNFEDKSPAEWLNEIYETEWYNNLVETSKRDAAEREAFQNKSGVERFLCNTWDIVKSGFGQAASAIYSTADFLENSALNILDLINIAGYINSDNKLANNVDLMGGLKNNTAELAQVAGANVSKHMYDEFGQLGADFTQLAISGVASAPMMITSILTAGSSAAVTPVFGLSKSASASTMAYVANGMNYLIKSPSFWTSMVYSFGPSYDSAIADGATEAEASFVALTNSVAGSIIEVGGGFESTPATYTGWEKFVSKYGGEGFENVLQNITETFIQGSVYDNSKILNMISFEYLHDLTSDFASGTLISAFYDGTLKVSSDISKMLKTYYGDYKNKKYVKTQQYQIDDNLKDSVKSIKSFMSGNGLTPEQTSLFLPDTKDTFEGAARRANRALFERITGEALPETYDETVNKLSNVLKSVNTNSDELYAKVLNSNTPDSFEVSSQAEAASGDYSLKINQILQEANNIINGVDIGTKYDFSPKSIKTKDGTLKFNSVNENSISDENTVNEMKAAREIVEYFGDSVVFVIGDISLDGELIKAKGFSDGKGTIYVSLDSGGSLADIILKEIGKSAVNKTDNAYAEYLQKAQLSYAGQPQALSVRDAVTESPYAALAVAENSSDSGAQDKPTKGLTNNGSGDIIGVGKESIKPLNQIKLTPPTSEIRSVLKNAGLSQNKINEIVSKPKKQKPKPQEYLHKDYIKNHLNEFENGGIVKIIPTKPIGTIGNRGGLFVLSEIEFNKIVKDANGSISKIEDALGLDKGYLGEKPVVVKFNKFSGLRIPQGNELGANPNYWIPGGYTIGGIKEAVIDPAIEGTYTYYYLGDE